LSYTAKLRLTICKQSLGPTAPSASGGSTSLTLHSYRDGLIKFGLNETLTVIRQLASNS
jgi:hypothetical protein